MQSLARLHHCPARYHLSHAYNLGIGWSGRCIGSMYFFSKPKPVFRFAEGHSFGHHQHMRVVTIPIGGGSNRMARFTVGITSACANARHKFLASMTSSISTSIPCSSVSFIAVRADTGPHLVQHCTEYKRHICAKDQFESFRRQR